MSSGFVYGCHAVEAVLSRAPERVLTMHFDAARADARLNALRERARSLGLGAEECRAHTLQRFVGEARHQGVVARVRPAAPLDEPGLHRWLSTASRPLILVLDGVQDPRNLGACLRSADAAGAGMVVTTRSGSVGLTPEARKAASGASEWVPVAQVGNLARVMATMKEGGVWLLGADERGEAPYYRADMRDATALVLGGEGAGLRRLTRESCDAVLGIPMHGGVASLNVSVAAGILLFEAARQRSDDDR